jgi:indolepyruvate ferredoxin oxidoreductase
MLGQEARLHEYKRPPPRLHPRQQFNRIVYSGGANPKIGIITVGKSYLDVRQALDDLGIDERRANEIGIRLFKVGCPWPLDYEHIRDFAARARD